MDSEQRIGSKEMQSFKRRLKPWCLLTPVLLVLLSMVVACGSAAAPDTSEPAGQAPVVTAPKVKSVPAVAPKAVAESEGGVSPINLVVMVGGWGHRFLPIHGTNCHNHYNVVHDFIIRTDENRGEIPGMATSWDISEDGKTWTITLRDDGKFHDGSKVTGEDLLFSWNQSWGPGSADVATSSTAANQAANTAKIELTGPQQVSLTTVNIDAGFGGLLSDSSGACQGIIRPAGDLATIHDAGAMTDYDKNPIGAGVMRLVKQVEDEVMSFERFDEYYAEDRRVPFQSMDLRKISEESTRAAALKAGEADIAPISLATKNLVESGGGKIIIGQEASYLRIMYIGCGWAEYDLACSDKRVRQAMGYAVDKEALRDDLFGGPTVFEAKGWAHVTPSSLGYQPDLDPYPYDPDKARELMAEAGYPGGKGFPKLIVNTWSSRAVPFLPESAQLAAEYWRTELGIETEVRVGDETALKKATKARKPLAGQILWRDNETRWDGRSTMRGSYASPPKEGTKGGNWSHTPETVDVVRAALAVFDPSKIDEVWHDVNLRLRDEHYEMAMGYVNIQWGVGPRIADWKPLPQAFYPSAYHTIKLVD